MEPDLRARIQEALGGAYVLEGELGAGGMSRVFRAREVALDRHVAVKVLAPELAAGINPGIAARRKASTISATSAVKSRCGYLR